MQLEEDVKKEAEKKQKKKLGKDQHGSKKETVKEMRIKEFGDKNLRYIVRIANKDLNGTKPIYLALTDIKGIGPRMGMIMARIFAQETGTNITTMIGSMAENLDEKLEAIVLNPGQHHIPIYLFNRQRDWETNESKHLLQADLDFQKRYDLQRMGKAKSYKGLRHAWGLPVRGQATKSTHHKGGGTIGVTKKIEPPKATGDKK